MSLDVYLELSEPVQVSGSNRTGESLNRDFKRGEIMSEPATKAPRFTGGYPHMMADCGTVHLLSGSQMTYAFLCGAPDYNAMPTTKPLNCQRCQKKVESKDANDD